MKNDFFITSWDRFDGIRARALMRTRKVDHISEEIGGDLLDTNLKG